MLGREGALQLEEKIGPDLNQKKMLSLNAQLKAILINSQWPTNLKNYIEIDLDASIDKFGKQPVTEALQSLLSGKLENFTANQELAKSLANIQMALTMKMHYSLYKFILTKQRVSVELFKLATIHFIILVAKKADINLSSTAEQQIVLENHFVFIPGNKYEFHDISRLLDRIFMQFGLTTRSDIFEHALIRYAKIDEFSVFCRFQDRMSDFYSETYTDMYTYRESGYFSMHLSLSHSNFIKLIKSLNDKAMGMAERIDACSFARETEHTTYSMRINATLMYQMLLSSEFQEFLKNILSDAIVLRNYKLFDANKIVPHKDILNAFGKLTERVNSKSQYVELALLKSFGLEPKVTSARYEAAKRYEGFAIETDFHLGITLSQACDLVAAINKSFSDTATLVACEDAIDGIQQIAILNDLLISKEFQAVMRKGIDQLAATDKDIFEELQLQSGTLVMTTKQVVKNLQDVAAKYAERASGLSSTLTTFSQLISAREPAEKMTDASFSVRKALSAQQATYHTEAEYDSFKLGDRSTIKQIQKMFKQQAEVKYVRNAAGHEIVESMPPRGPSLVSSST